MDHDGEIQLAFRRLAEAHKRAKGRKLPMTEHDGEIQLAFRRIAETRKQLEEAGEFRKLAELHKALGIVGSTMLGSMNIVLENIKRAKYGEGK